MTWQRPNPEARIDGARPETPRGSTPAVNPHTRSAPKSRGLPLDEARLRPHLRQMQPPAFTPAGTTDNVQTGNTLGAMTTARYAPDPTDLRGIPAIGRGVAGVQPGTDPYRETERRDPRRAA